MHVNGRPYAGPAGSTSLTPFTVFPTPTSSHTLLPLSISLPNFLVQVQFRVLLSFNNRANSLPRQQ